MHFKSAKYLITIVLLLVGLIGCGQSVNQEGNPEGLVFPNYPKEQQYTYVLHVNSKTPYELYFDDILVEWDTESGANESIELNDYILKNGKYKLKIRFLPRSGSQLLDPKDVVYDDNMRWKAFFVPIRKNWQAPLSYEDKIDYAKTELKIVSPPNAVPFWDQEFEVEVDKLPYELKGWSDGEDLSKMDEKELEQEVLAVYNQVRNVLNNGDLAQFYKIVNQRRQEYIISLYTTEENFNKRYQKGVNNIIDECKGNMLPVENYKVELSAYGKLVTLVVPTGRYRHWTALQSRSDKYGTTFWKLSLYKPKGSKEFVVIR